MIQGTHLWEGGGGRILLRKKVWRQLRRCHSASPASVPLPPFHEASPYLCCLLLLLCLLRRAYEDGDRERGTRVGWNFRSSQGHQRRLGVRLFLPALRGNRWCRLQRTESGPQRGAGWCHGVETRQGRVQETQGKDAQKSLQQQHPAGEGGPCLCEQRLSRLSGRKRRCDDEGPSHEKAVGETDSPQHVPPPLNETQTEQEGRLAARLRLSVSPFPGH
mmetsp:Transcript_34874/g.68852  ORF Transcript_34874/g.68852 Transcript_34874/m.68852 type:complete len:218 (-) Transcript_34874:325-978(-)